MKYIVWFSWWIDSTFVALHLKKQWHDVLLVHLKNTIEPNKCCQLPKDLMNLANKLNLPLKIVDTTKEFKNLVIDNFAKNYISGLTPNPCINCNWLVRFPILNKIREELWYDKIATGHYAKIININWEYFLARPKDLKKDQTYMLYRIIWLTTSLNEPLLRYLDFPLWNYKKEEIKKLISSDPYFLQLISLQTSPISSNFHSLKNYKESQNICFIPDDDYPRFLKQNYNVITKPGPIYDKKWNYLWEHKGLIYYTIWQRRNIFLHQEKIAMNKKWYVIKINTKNNVLILWEEKDLYNKEVIITNTIRHYNISQTIWKITTDKLNFIFRNLQSSSSEIIWYHLQSTPLYWKIRYHHPGEYIETFVKLEDTNYKITFKNPVRAPTPWQHLVIYLWNKEENDIVIGWGVINQL